MLIDIAIGHGYMPNGKFDPGAVNQDGTQEHSLATRVVEAMETALVRSGVADLMVERDAGPSHDPDYRGSAKRVNAEKAGLAIEVHFDSSNAPVGGFGIYSNDASRGRTLSEKVKNHWGQAGLSQRKSYADVRGLYFLHATHCPALIWECDHTARHDPSTLDKMGEALAAGICDYLGVPFIGPGKEPMAPVPTGNPPISVSMVDAIAASACGVTGEGAAGVYVLNLDGGVNAMHGAPFYGSYPGLKGQSGDRGGGFNRIGPRKAGLVGYICYSRRDEPYEFGPGLNGFPA